jgi:multidrug efflux pump subunit AcrB
MADIKNTNTNTDKNKILPGPIALFAKHPTASNLIMILMIIAGVWGILKMNSQFLPSFGIDVVVVTFEWPGANSEDIDKNIVQLVEPELRFLDSVKRIRSTSTEGVASLLIEFEAATDMQSALSNVEAAVSRITTLPVDTLKPNIRRIVRYETITKLIISGKVPEVALKAYARDFRDSLLAAGIDRIELFGSRDQEIWVEAPEKTLRRLDLTLDDISKKIRETSIDVPSGNVGQGLRQVRSLGLVTNADGLRRIEIKSQDDGRKIYLDEIAAVTEGFKNSNAIALRKNVAAIELHLMRALDSDALVLAGVVDKFLSDKNKNLPVGLSLERYDSATNLLDERINLLLNNAIGGLVIVAIILFVFLRASVAFWVLLGIPICFMATLGVMFATGQSINMISLFGLIMALGIVVDDAIVVGEHADFQKQSGLEPISAAVMGARRMAGPVVSASLTTICAFLPLILISGIIGQVISAIPLVIVAVLLASLLECFYVLPGHLNHGMSIKYAGFKLYNLFRIRFDNWFAEFRDIKFHKLVLLSIEWRYVTLAIVLALFLSAVGLVISGRVSFNFFPTPESDKIVVNVKMVSGTPRDQTILMLKEVERAAYRVSERLSKKDDKLIQMSLIKVGVKVSGSSNSIISGAPEDTVGGLIVELLTADKRSVRTWQFIDAWRAEVKNKAGLKTLTIREVRGGPPGRDIDIRLMGPNINDLKSAAGLVINLLKRYPGVSNVEDDIPYGKRETILSVNKRGRSLGFSNENIGMQLRNAIQGKISKRFARDEEEVAVRVMYPRDEVKSAILDSLHLRAPGGQEIPLMQLASSRETIGFSTIKRENGSRQIAITAEIDASITSVGTILAAIRRDGIFKIADRAGLKVGFKGKAEEQKETFADMKLGMFIGLAGIYIVLAWAFANYIRPIVVMAVIPMGFIGAAFGHWLLGYNLTILSLVGLIGLSGIIINGSIILVTTIDEKVKDTNLIDAIVEASCIRLRPILLTSATTIGGLMPLLFERSIQAQFLIPMAITIVFGLGVATLLILFVVPSFIATLSDIQKKLKINSV